MTRELLLLNFDGRAVRSLQMTEPLPRVVYWGGRFFVIGRPTEAGGELYEEAYGVVLDPIPPDLE